jgi:hypothetical protein
VISLADITDEQGSYIVAKAWVRLKAHKLLVGNRTRSIQQLLSPQPWSAWRIVLQSFTHPNRRCLKTQLGAWPVDTGEIRPNFKSYCTQDAAYIKHAAHTSIHPIKNEASNQNITTTITSAIPNDAIPCFISATGNIHTKLVGKLPSHITVHPKHNTITFYLSRMHRLLMATQHGHSQ